MTMEQLLGFYAIWVTVSIAPVMPACEITGLVDVTSHARTVTCHCGPSADNPFVRIQGVTIFQRSPDVASDVDRVRLARLNVEKTSHAKNVNILTDQISGHQVSANLTVSVAAPRAHVTSTGFHFQFQCTVFGFDDDDKPIDFTYNLTLTPTPTPTRTPPGVLTADTRKSLTGAAATLTSWPHAASTASTTTTTAAGDDRGVSTEERDDLQGHDDEEKIEIYPAVLILVVVVILLLIFVALVVYIIGRYRRPVRGTSASPTDMDVVRSLINVMTSYGLGNAMTSSSGGSQAHFNTPRLCRSEADSSIYDVCSSHAASDSDNTLRDMTRRDVTLAGWLNDVSAENVSLRKIQFYNASLGAPGSDGDEVDPELYLEPLQVALTAASGVKLPVASGVAHRDAPAKHFLHNDKNVNRKLPPLPEDSIHPSPSRATLTNPSAISPSGGAHGSRGTSTPRRQQQLAAEARCVASEARGSPRHISQASSPSLRDLRATRGEQGPRHGSTLPRHGETLASSFPTQRAPDDSPSPRSPELQALPAAPARPSSRDTQCHQSSRDWDGEREVAADAAAEPELGAGTGRGAAGWFMTTEQLRDPTYLTPVSDDFHTSIQ